MPDPEQDLQLTIDGEEIPVGEIPTSGAFVPLGDGVWEERDNDGRAVRRHASSREAARLNAWDKESE